MYCEFFHLTEQPFRLTPDPQFVFASKQHARAKAYMESTIWLADGFVVLTGEIGAGKTTMIESFLAELPPDIIVAHISQTQLTPVEFLQTLLVEFGFEPFKQRKVELLGMIKDYMVKQYADGKKIVLIIDEAQNLSRQVLEEVRLLSGLETRKEKLLRIIIAGQPELAAELDSPRLAQLMQRVRLRFHLSALSKRETHEYIAHRLNVAGAAGRRIFTEDACDVVFRYSGGVPRLINLLCDTAMLCGFAEERHLIDDSIVETAVSELQWVEYSERKHGKSFAPPEPSVSEPPVRRDLPLGRLEVLHRDQLVAEQPLRVGKVIIGRTPENDLQIRSKFVSRHHVQVVSDETTSYVEDLNSTNGVFIRSQRVKRQNLADGDILQLGEHKILYRDMRTAAGIASSSAGSSQVESLSRLAGKRVTPDSDDLERAEAARKPTRGNDGERSIAESDARRANAQAASEEIAVDAGKILGAEGDEDVEDMIHNVDPADMEPEDDVLETDEDDDSDDLESRHDADTEDDSTDAEDDELRTKRSAADDSVDSGGAKTLSAARG